jgi:hypothetical protein
MSASGWWSLIALALGSRRGLLNALAAWKWQNFKAGHAQMVLSDEDAKWVPRLTWCGPGSHRARDLDNGRIGLDPWGASPEQSIPSPRIGSPRRTASLSPSGLPERANRA